MSIRNRLRRLFCFDALRNRPVRPRRFFSDPRERLKFERLEVRTLLAADFVISEFLASNTGVITDQDGDTSDWIEIHNAGDESGNLDGWHLSDSMGNLDRWQFPNVEVPSGGFLIVFASDKNRALAGQELHTNFKLSTSNTEDVILVEPDGTTIKDSYTNYPRQFMDMSHGRVGSTWLYLTPSPGTQNAASGLSYPLVTSPEGWYRGRGVYDNAFSVTLSVPDSDATIYFTLDGSPPSATNGKVYEEAIQISSTTTLRAIASQAGFPDTEVITETYLFPGSAIRQTVDSPTAEGLPETWFFLPAGYDLDATSGVAGPFGPISNTISESLRTLPSISLVTDQDNLFDNNVGIYTNPIEKGAAWEREVSFEILYPDNDTESVQVDAGIRITGASSRGNPKKSFRMLFKKQYDESKFTHTLFPESAVEEYDELILRGFTFGDSFGDHFVRESFFRMQSGPELGEFMHVYINGMYWGVYDVSEKPRASFLDDYFGGDEDDYDVISGGDGSTVETVVFPEHTTVFNAESGNNDAWKQMLLIASQIDGANANEKFFQLQGKDATGNVIPSMPNYLDMENFTDYLLVNFFSNTGTGEWTDSGNWRVARRSRNDGITIENEPFRFFVWDADDAFSDPIANPAVQVGTNSTLNFASFGYLYKQLRLSSEFKLLMADRAQKHLFHDGVLAESNAIDRLRKSIAEVERAMAADASRWGDPTTHSIIQDRVINITGDFLVGRVDELVAEMNSVGLLPSVVTPSLDQHGGSITPASIIHFTDAQPGIEIHYTMDGVDPRDIEAANEIYSNAIVYDDANGISINNDVTIKYRAKSGSTWSALGEATFKAEQPAQSLRISEIMYHAAHPTENEENAGYKNDKDFDYLEIQNTGDTPVDLTNIQVAGGVSFTFNGGTLAAGEFVLVVENQAAFQSRYGMGSNVAGEYSGALSNGGETVQLLDPNLIVIQSVAYEDEPALGWYSQTDGYGRSLEMINADFPVDESSDPIHWRPSLEASGSPGLPNASVIGRAFKDINGNGIQDLGEPGISERAVTMHHVGNDGKLGGGDDTVIGTVITKSDGVYAFRPEQTGFYYLSTDIQDGLSISIANSGENDRIDSDFDMLTGNTPVFAVAPLLSLSNIDLGLHDLSTVFNHATGELQITGTEFPDRIAISSDAGKVTVNGIVVDQGITASAVNSITVYGHDGDDHIDLSGVTSASFSSLLTVGSVSITGSNGDDHITGSEFGDDIQGDGGNDTIFGIAGDDTVNGGEGDDAIYGGQGSDDMFGMSGNDRYVFTSEDAQGATDEIFELSLQNDDVIDFSAYPHQIFISLGTTTPQTFDFETASKLTLSVADGIADLIGTAHGDNLTGNILNNTIRGGAGDDWIWNISGNNVLWGDDGIDTIFGGTDNDFIQGGSGADSIFGDDGNDVIDTGDGDDVINGGGGDDKIFAGPGNDSIDGGPGLGDVAYGDAGTDTFSNIAVREEEGPDTAPAAVPTIDAPVSIGNEDEAIGLNITASAGDPDGSEMLSAVTISGIPIGATLSTGFTSTVTNRTAVLDVSQLPGLTILPAPNSDHSFDLTVSVTATELASGNQRTTTQTLPVTVNAVVDQPSISINRSSALGNANEAILLMPGLIANLNDNDRSEWLSYTISNVPSQASLTHGQNLGNGVWKLTSFEILDVAYVPDPTQSEPIRNVTLSINAIATEESTGDTATATEPFIVSVYRTGDVDRDQNINASDIDLLRDATIAQSSDTRYDLNQDGQLNAADRAFLIEDILGTRPGDSNLDLRVDLGDLARIKANFGSSGTSWADGDVDAWGDSTVSSNDLDALLANYGFDGTGGGAGMIMNDGEILAELAADVSDPAPILNSHDLDFDNDVDFVDVDLGFEWMEYAWGDIDFDGDIDAEDIDVITSAINTSGTTPHYDLDRDGNIDADDRDHLIADILQTTKGDLNLDLVVSAWDLGRVDENIGMPSPGWSDGDVDGDGDIDTIDVSLALGQFDNVLEIGTETHSADDLTFEVVGSVALNGEFSQYTLKLSTTSALKIAGVELQITSIGTAELSQQLPFGTVPVLYQDLNFLIEQDASLDVDFDTQWLFSSSELEVEYGSETNTLLKGRMLLSSSQYFYTRDITQVVLSTGGAFRIQGRITYEDGSIHYVDQTLTT